MSHAWHTLRCVGYWQAHTLTTRLAGSCSCRQEYRDHDGLPGALPCSQAGGTGPIPAPSGQLAHSLSEALQGLVLVDMDTPSYASDVSPAWKGQPAPHSTIGDKSANVIRRVGSEMWGSGTTQERRNECLLAVCVFVRDASPCLHDTA